MNETGERAFRISFVMEVNFVPDPAWPVQVSAETSVANFLLLIKPDPLRALVSTMVVTELRRSETSGKFAAAGVRIPEFMLRHNCIDGLMDCENSGWPLRFIRAVCFCHVDSIHLVSSKGTVQTPDEAMAGFERNLAANRPDVLEFGLEFDRVICVEIDMEEVNRIKDNPYSEFDVVRIEMK